MNTPIDVKHKTINGIEIFEFHGELDETNSDKTFAAIYTAIGDFTAKKIIFNFVGLKYLNSKSIGYIAEIYSNVEDNKGSMILAQIPDPVKDTLELVGITQLIRLANTEPEAINTIELPQA
jgi:anti-anti-sigma factor